jgi:hypothetical protein
MKGLNIRKDTAPGPIRMAEEATALLRRTPLEQFALYYIGTLPFMVALIWFWADMSRSANAGGRLAASSLGLVLLFVWMKYWQARFSASLSARLQNSTTVPLVRESLLSQTIIQPWGAMLLPLAMLLSIPFGWCFAFFQNVTVISSHSTSDLIARSYRQARLWPMQNHLLLLIVMLVGLVLFANIALTVYLLPKLLSTLLGIETVFSTSSRFLLNSTFWATIILLTHLFIDPLVKAIYVLRCHYGESLATGADLLSELHSLRSDLTKSAGLLVLMMMFALPMTGVAAADQPVSVDPAVRNGAVNVRELDKSIEKVIQDPRFSWRLPRETEASSTELPGFMRSTIDLVSDWWKNVQQWWSDFLKWLEKKLPKPGAKNSFLGRGFADYVSIILYLLLGVLLVTGSIYFYRKLRSYRKEPEPEPVSVVAITPDLEDEQLTADELSEDRWNELARELIAKGEFRLGLRALYLATLSALGEVRLITIARFKSNHEYEKELHRHGHALPQLTEAFSGNLSIFEGVWYGMYPVERPVLDQFLANYKRIMSNVRQG